MKRCVFVVILTILFLQVFSQHSEPSVLQAYKADNKITFDGVLSEPQWQQAMHINNFTQRDLHFGEPVSERTETAILYDNNTLYIGVWCYQKDPSKIVAKNLNRDFDYESDDNFQILISPFDDNRNGYLFVINPNGARADIQVYGGEDGNEDWNGVWDAKTTITDEGWFAEIYIPFTTLQFKKGSKLKWAVNFERDIVSENEQSLWQGWSRDYSIYAVNNAGKLVGLKDIAFAKKFEFKPYGLAGWQHSREEGNQYPLKAGADLNIYLSPTLKLNLTSYTDFAQVESDKIPVNLSRFGVYYPEKRQFFLEGYDLYNYYLGDRNNVFYSRQIGVEDGEQVPIIAGARLYGKAGKNNIGFLNIHDGKTDSVSSTNNMVFRYKRDIGRQSYIGGIFTNKINNKTSNQVFGLDGAYQTSNFLKNKNLTMAGTFAVSTEHLTYRKNAVTYRFSVDYPNDLIDNFMAVGSMQGNFNPELGYLRRTNYDSYSWYFRLTPRVFTKYGIKRLALKPWGFTAYYTHSTGELESFRNETRPLGAVFRSGDRFEINFIQSFDRLDQPFSLTNEIVIPKGKYWMYKQEVQVETYQARRFWVFLLFNWGGFYTGTIKTFESALGLNINKHLNLNSEYSVNFVKLPQSDVITNEISLYLNYAFTTKINFSLFGQYNDLDQVMLYNFRLHWIPKVGSDFYLVYNIGYEEQIKEIEFLKPQTTNAAVKLVYRFVF